MQTAVRRVGKAEACSQCLRAQAGRQAVSQVLGVQWTKQALSPPSRGETDNKQINVICQVVTSRVKEDGRGSREASGGKGVILVCFWGKSIPGGRNRQGKGLEVGLRNVACVKGDNIGNNEADLGGTGH